MTFLLFLLLFTIVGMCILSAWIKDSSKDEDVDYSYIDTESRFADKLEKLLKNVTTEEQVLYKRIFDTVVYTYPDAYKIDNACDSLNINDVTKVQIKNICVYIDKVTKPTSFFADGTVYGRKLAKYECVGFDILDPKTNQPINLSIPEEQFPIFDLLVNFIIWKVEIYYDKLLKDEKKKVSEEHQADVREALKVVKPIR
jgi:hypothetical protein